MKQVSPAIDAAAEREYDEVKDLEAWEVADRLRMYRKCLARGASHARSDQLLGRIFACSRALAERISQ